MLAESGLCCASIQELRKPFYDCRGEVISEDLEAEARRNRKLFECPEVDGREMCIRDRCCCFGLIPVMNSDWFLRSVICNGLPDSSHLFF